MNNMLRRLRGALGNSLIWGAAWFGGAALVLGTLFLGGVLPPSAYSWEIILQIATNFGVSGVLAGGAFSAVVRFAFRDRFLSEIRSVRFTLGGALTAGTLLPVVAFAALGPALGVNMLLPLAGLAGVFGGATAAVTIRLAKNSSLRSLGDSLEGLALEQDEAVALLSGEAV